MEKPTLENPTQLNKDIQRTDLQNTQKSNTDLSSTHSIPILSPYPSPFGDAAEPQERKGTEARSQSAVDVYREIIMDNISYNVLIQDRSLDRDRLDEIVDLMLETVCTARKTIRIAGDDYPAELVKSKFMKLDSEHMPLVNVRRQDVFMLPLCHRVGKLPPDLMRLLVVHFPRLKGLHQVMGYIAAPVQRLGQGKGKFNVCRFIAAPERGHQHFPVRLVRVLDIVKGFAQRAFNRLNLCNRHISLNAPFISSMSSW